MQTDTLPLLKATGARLGSTRWGSAPHWLTPQPQYPNAPSSCGGCFAREIFRINEMHQGEKLAYSVCDSHRTCPYETEDVAAVSVVIPVLGLHVAARRLVSLKQLSSAWAHCLGAANCICLWIWLTVLPWGCFMPGSSLLHHLHTPTACSCPCVTYTLVLVVLLLWLHGDPGTDEE